MTRRWQLEQSQLVPQPREAVFAFFSDAHNLEKLTPGFLGFRILTPDPIEMREGTLIDYSLRLHGMRLRWTTRIECFEPPARFADLQLRGPYRHWRHLHEFEETRGGTRMRDVVDYELPLGPLGTVARALFVRKALRRIFDFRRAAIAEILSPPGSAVSDGSPSG
jgi:ligand-binding SRPBCC domain-containing protein